MKIINTTVLAVRRGDKLALASDGQVTMGNTIAKHGAVKVRRMFKDRILAGFAGSTADAFSLFTRFEAKLEEFHGNLERSAVELARDWRMDKSLRRLEAMLIVGDSERTFLISGNGDVVEPDDGVIAIGSGGPYALAAARALVRHTEMDAEEIARKAMSIASEICIYTNEKIAVETLDGKA